MILNPVDYKFISKYFPFAVELFRDRLNFEIDQSIVFGIKKFTKHYNLDQHEKELLCLLALIDFDLHQAFQIESQPLDLDFQNKIKADFYLSEILKSELLKVSFVGKKGKLSIPKGNLLLKIQEAIQSINLPKHSYKSVAKYSHYRGRLKFNVEVLVEVFKIDIPIKIKSKNDLYRIIYDLLLILSIDLAFGKNRISTPEELIKKLLQK